ncbi:hypothetical protein [Nonomuraea turkmeniaca]|nr:hypothetical protein [Nonomuraea turkmeniaca]
MITRWLNAPARAIAPDHQQRHDERPGRVDQRAHHDRRQLEPLA